MCPLGRPCRLLDVPLTILPGRHVPRALLGPRDPRMRVSVPGCRHRQKRCPQGTLPVRTARRQRITAANSMLLIARATLVAAVYRVLSTHPHAVYEFRQDYGYPYTRTVYDNPHSSGGYCCASDSPAGTYGSTTLMSLSAGSRD